MTNFSEYVEACMKHLESKQSENKPYYEEINKEYIYKSMKDINIVLEEACNNKLITQDEYKAMNTEGKNVCKFYANFKVHKEHNHGELPEIRPIVSGSGSFLENVALYVEHHVKHEATKHTSRLKDTPDFLRKLEELKQKGPLPKNAMVVVTDVSALFTNILRKEGLQTTREALNERANPEVPTEFIIRLLNLLLKNNIFEFNERTYRQCIGAAMGYRPIHPYADIFMARKIDQQFEILANKYGTLEFFKRFLDDLFSIFTGTTNELHKVIDELNKIHPTKQFTTKHTTPKEEAKEDNCNCEKTNYVPFLDTLVTIEGGTIDNLKEKNIEKYFKGKKIFFFKKIFIYLKIKRD